MADLGFVSTISATVGQTLTFPLPIEQMNTVTYAQSAAGLQDSLIINNLSGCTFRVTLQPTGRSFTLPSGVPTNPLPIGLRGVYDDEVTLYVESIASGAFANQVHFDFFSGNEPILYVASSGLGAGGGISTTNITTSSISWIAPDQWTLQEDGSGNMDLSDSTTSKTFAFNRTGGVSFDNGALTSNGSGTITTAGASLGGNTSINNLNSLTQVLGQTIVGLWCSISSVQSFHVSSNAATNVISITPPANGKYRVNFYFRKNNTTASAVTAQLAWTDLTSNAQTRWFYADNNGGGFIVFHGSTTVANGTWLCATVTIAASTASNIVISFTDPTGAASDDIDADIEMFLAV